MIHVYGIKNCSTVKKALEWLVEHNVDFQFHDYKKEPVTLSKLNEWEKLVSWQSLLNKKGTSWRKIEKEVQNAITNENFANDALLANNSLIKRPIIEINNKIIIVGFNEEEYLKKII